MNDSGMGLDRLDQPQDADGIGLRKRFDTKIAILIRDDLEGWQRMNVTAFLSSGIAASDPDVIGEGYADADGTAYHALFRQPVVVFEGSKENLTTSHQRALGRGMTMAVYTADMFITGHDEANRAAVRAVGRDDLDLVGIALHGPKNAVDKVMKGAHLHP